MHNVHGKPRHAWFPYSGSDVDRYKLIFSRGKMSARCRRSQTGDKTTPIPAWLIVLEKTSLRHFRLALRSLSRNPNTHQSTCYTENNMDRRFPQRPSGLRRARVTRMLIIGLLLASLVVASVTATVLVLRATGQLARISASTPTTISATSAPGQTSTPESTPVLQGSLYTAATGSLTRIDLQTGKVTWTIDATNPSAPLVMGNQLFFENQDSSNSFLEAASVEAGRQLWRTQKYPSGFLLGANNMLYDSTCNLYATSDPCHLYGINASTGARLWSYDLPQGNAWIALQKGELYGVSYTSFFALNASTGAPLWQKGLFRFLQRDQAIKWLPWLLSLRLQCQHWRRTLACVYHKLDPGHADDDGWRGLCRHDQWHHLRGERADWHQALEFQRRGHSRSVALLCGDGLRRNTQCRWADSPRRGIRCRHSQHPLGSERLHGHLQTTWPASSYAATRHHDPSR